MDEEELIRLADSAVAGFDRWMAKDTDPVWAVGRQAAVAWRSLLHSGERAPEVLAALDDLMGQGRAVPRGPWPVLRVFYGHWRGGRPGATGADAERIESIVRPVLGYRAWRVSLGVGSFITMEFGAPVLPPESGNATHGQWHLWIAMAAWRLESDTEVIVACEYPRPFISRAIQILEDRPITGVAVRAPSLETTFEFGELRLRTFSMCPTDEGLGDWMLWTPSGQVLTVGEGPVWSMDEPAT